MNFGDQDGERGPSRRGFFTIGIIGALIFVWMIYVQVFKAEEIHAKTEGPVQLHSGRQEPVKPPPEPPQPKPSPPPAVQKEPPPARAAHRQEKSEEQKMREKMRLLAHYSRPTVEGAGTDGRRVGRQGVSIDDDDMPHEMRPNRQTLEVPSVYGRGGRNGGGNVWTRDFYEQGNGRSGVLQRATSPYVIRRGWKIPARLDDPINTDTPGQITATVVQDIRDSATGRYTLIPAGSQLVGAYDTRVGYGQDRVPSAWDQLNFPNGDFMPLAAMPGADRTGVAGIPGEVNNHLWSTAGRSLLLTITGAGADYAMRSGGGGDYGLDEAFRREGGRQLDRQSQGIWNRGGNRPPTVTAESGDIFLIQVTQNLEFPGPYDGEVDLELAD